MKQQDEESEETLLKKIQRNKELNMKQKTAKSAIIVYSLLFQFISIYLNTNAAAIQEVYTQSAFLIQALIYCLLIFLYLPLVKIVTIEDGIITIEDGVNILIIFNIFLLVINIIVENDYYSLGFFSITFSMLAGGISLILPMMIADLYKSFYNLFTEDYYVRLSLGFYFMSFFFQNYQFKQMIQVTPYYFFYESQFLKTNFTDIIKSLQKDTPSIYIGFSILSIIQFYYCYTYFKKQQGIIKKYNEDQMQYSTKSDSINISYDIQ
ncbi:hypothetical protein ABPG72_012574 [Tetrahymena utriculariae]